MPRNQQRIHVIKLPLKGIPTSKPQVFPRMPRLYLELIENKSKIRQDLINKEHVPISVAPTIEKIDEISSKSYSESYSKPSPVQQSNNFSNRLDMLLSDNSSDEYNSDNSSDNSSDKSSVSPSSISELSINEKFDKPPPPPPPPDNDVKSEVSDNLSVRLKDLLNDDSDVESVKSLSNKYSKHRDKGGHSIGHTQSPPTLAELEAQGGYIPRKELRDIGHQSLYNEQQDEDSKRELLFKFDLLRKSYPGSSIPEYTIHTDLSTMEKAYSDCVRRLSLDSSVESYKTYLTYGFMGCEFILGNFFGFDMHGFTQQQIISMHSYEKILIELGEKSYVPKGSKWPVELRLLFMIIMNAAFFIISKMMMKKTGANLMGMINGMNGGGNRQSTGNIPSQPKRKMRGPNIDINDLPDM
jgi:hypothetical protein